LTAHNSRSEDQYVDFNRSISLLGLCLGLALLSGQASAEIKMGYVNFQKLLEEAPQTKTAMQGLENEFAPAAGSC